jgi:hypothetical protein
MSLKSAAAMPVADVVRAMDTSEDGLSGDVARRRLAEAGENALRSHGRGRSPCSCASCAIRC